MTEDAATAPASVPVPAALPTPPQATSDAHLIALWLHGRSPRTQRAYHADVATFLAHGGAPAHLVQATVGHASLATTSRDAHARPGDSSSRYLPR